MDQWINNLLNGRWYACCFPPIGHLNYLTEFVVVFQPLGFRILVNMDDQLVEQFVDEDDFLVSIEFDNQLGQFEVILSC